MKVSIILPVYNNEKSKVFTKCLDSLVNQSYKNYELIIVDNGSTDNTLEIIDRYRDKNVDKDIKTISEPKKGRGSARRKGELNSSGEIILMTDSDCIVPEDWIWLMIRPILENDFDSVQGFEINNNNNFWSNKIQEKLNYKYREGIKNIIGYIDTKNFAIKRTLLESIGFSSDKYENCNDTALSIELSKIDIKINFNKKSIVKHENIDNLKGVFIKQFDRGYWTKIITSNNKKYLKNNHLLKETNQTLISFFIFFPGLFITFFKNRYKDFYFDLIEGVAWRLGLIFGIVYNLFKYFY